MPKKMSKNKQTGFQYTAVKLTICVSNKYINNFVQLSEIISPFRVHLRYESVLYLCYR